MLLGWRLASSLVQADLSVTAFRSSLEASILGSLPPLFLVIGVQSNRVATEKLGSIQVALPVPAASNSRMGVSVKNFNFALVAALMALGTAAQAQRATPPSTPSPVCHGAAAADGCAACSEAGDPGSGFADGQACCFSEACSARVPPAAVIHGA